MSEQEIKSNVNQLNTESAPVAKKATVTKTSENSKENSENKPVEKKEGAEAGNTRNGRPSRDPNARRSFDRGDRRPARNNERGDRRQRPDRPGANRRRNDVKRKKDFPESNQNIESTIIQVRRVSKTVKGGKKMRFSALVVAGDKQGKVGFALAKGLDFQDAVNKATKKAKETMIPLDLNDDASVKFSSNFKYKSARIYLKPALNGTGLIAGGFLRPVLQLAGVQNIYSKIIGSNNKVVGVRAAFEILKKYYTLETKVVVPKAEH
jgi:small subunit ribosomal protein S5